MSGLQADPRPQITVESITEADLKEAMMGSQTAPTYQEQFGITSAPLGTTGYTPTSIAALELEAAKALARAQAEAVAAQQANRPADPFAANTADEAEKFRQLYGNSENEKGALRKREAELMEAFNGLMAQHEALQQRMTQPQQYGQGTPNPPQFAQPQQYVPQIDPFAGIGDDDVIQGKQVKDLVYRHIAPEMFNLQNLTQQAMQRTADLEARLVKQAKETVGLTPVDEYRLMGKNPWLRNLPPASRTEALAGLRQAELNLAPQPQPQAQLPVATEPQQRILNRLTYVEGSVPNVPDTSQAALEAAKQRDYAMAMLANADTGERAKMLRAWALKYGERAIGQPPSDIAH